MSDQNKVGNISVSFGSDPSVTLYNLGRATAKQAAKINTLVHSIFSHDESGKGGVSENTSDPRYNMTVNFASENGISPMLTGIDGTSIYTFAGNTLVGGLKEYITLHPIFYKIDNVDPMWLLTGIGEQQDNCVPLEVESPIELHIKSIVRKEFEKMSEDILQKLSNIEDSVKTSN